MAAARAIGRLRDMKAWYTHNMQSFYLVENYAAAYANATVPLPEIEIVEADGATHGATKLAVRVKQAGRPRVKRIRSSGGMWGDGTQPAHKKRYRCSTCGGLPGAWSTLATDTWSDSTGPDR